MEEIKNSILNEREDIIKISVSSPFSKNEEFNKITIRPVNIKNKPCFQAERFKNNQVFHLNMSNTEFSAFLENIFKKYAQICVFKSGITVTFAISKNGNIKTSESKNNLQIKQKNTENNRQKEYIFNEGENIPPLVDLGVFTEDFKIVKSKYDKFKQINRFIEIVNDAFTNDKNENITILDFGCGKSYLTFIIYYYFREIKKKNVKIIGYDLKKDVVENKAKYSLEEIESKLSVICYRKKVSFESNEVETKNNDTQDVTTYNLNTVESTPAWVKAVLDTAKTLN